MKMPSRLNGRGITGRGNAAVHVAPQQQPMRPMSCYEIFGPFELPLLPVGAVLDVSQAALERFWAAVNGREGGLAEAYGCFVFSVRGRNWRNELPWYVGRADRKPFLATCLDQTHLAAYAAVLAEIQHGSAYLHLVSLMTSAGRFGRLGRGTQQEIGFVESLLTGAALGRNPRLGFSQELIPSCTVSIPGLLSPQNARLTIDARALRLVLGF